MSRILFFVPHPADDAGYRYRVEQFLPYLKSAGHDCTIRPFSTAGLYRALRSRGTFPKKIAHMLYCSLRRLLQVTDLTRFDLVVIQREVFPFFVPLLESWVLFTHPRVVFAFDDAIYVSQPNAEELNHPMLYKFKYGHGVGKVMRHSMHVVAGNRILAEHARNFNSHVSIVPTVVDCERYCAKERTTWNAITVGWVGSRSTVSYLKEIEPALMKLAVENPGKVRFRFIGAPEYIPNLPDSESLPFRLETELEDIASFDIGVMPLPNTEWTRGKCAFKAIQYMASGVATVASPVGVTTDLIQHDCNGLLAADNEWFKSLNRLVRDGSLRIRLAREARKTIECSYSLQIWGPKFADLLSQLAHENKQSECARTVVADS